MYFRKLAPILIVILLHSSQLCSQHVSLIKYCGELGVGVGEAIYTGEIGGNKFSNRHNFSFLARKLLTRKFGVRVNYEFVPLSGNDSLSRDLHILKRGFKFYRTFHELNVLFEYFFSDIKYLNTDNYFIPNVGIGMGYMLNMPVDYNNFEYNATTRNLTFSQYWPICTLPVSFGLTYRLKNGFNFYGVFMYRYTTSGFIDKFDHSVPISVFENTYIAKKNGHDIFFTFKVGIVKTFIKKYGSFN
jgi:hypothetical protein